MNLDAQQETAATATEDRILLVAGAGSGKTRTLIGRIEHLIKSGVSPHDIISFSFTRKAAGEISTRLEEEIGPAAHGITVGTMHAIAMRFLRSMGDLIGLKPGNLTVYSEWEQDFIIREAARDMGLFKNKKWKVPKKVIDSAFAGYYERGDEPEETHPAHGIFHKVIRMCRENNALTFGGLLIGLELLLPHLAQNYHFKHILVDEVQDIDKLQWRLIHGMADAFGASIFACGDQDQAIYEWRGATPDYMLEIQNTYTTYLLENNYRSDGNIVDVANRLIRHNQKRIDKTMNAARPKMSPMTYFSDVDSEVMVRVVRGLVSDSRTKSTLRRAVLARNHVLLRKLSMLLTDAKIEHQYIGKRAGLTNTETFRRFHAFLKLAINPYDNFAMLMLRQVLGMTNKEYGALRLKAMGLGKSHFQTWRETDSFPGREFADMYDAMEAGEATHVLDWSEQLLARLRNQEAYDDTMDFIFSSVENEKFHNHGISGYLGWLATIDIQDEIADDGAGLMLMTVHAAKGLEWPTVLIAGMNEGLLPSKQAIKNDEVEQERRLCYVAMTRARDSLILTSRPEVTHSEHATYENPISRFIREALQPEKEEKEQAAC